ncbi:MAG: hypothetical protein L0Y72_14400 [Gemmataceae bacterium]|nr:hypothetical protein [Gemmataceae bacterium]MCI0640257.1 hypothetical protein [Gemmataceae bacterium]MCI0740234.1 hypothetical protein [Gemmataceae bacterium]
MMGMKTYAEVRAEVKAAFDKEGIAMEEWLDNEIRKLNRESPRDTSALRTLRMIQKALLEDDTSAKSTKRGRKAVKKK